MGAPRPRALRSACSPVSGGSTHVCHPHSAVWQHRPLGAPSKQRRAEHTALQLPVGHGLCPHPAAAPHHVSHPTSPLMHGDRDRVSLCPTDPSSACGLQQRKGMEGSDGCWVGIGAQSGPLSLDRGGLGEGLTNIRSWGCGADGNDVPHASPHYGFSTAFYYKIGAEPSRGAVPQPRTHRSGPGAVRCRRGAQRPTASRMRRLVSARARSLCARASSRRCRRRWNVRSMESGGSSLLALHGSAGSGGHSASDLPSAAGIPEPGTSGPSGPSGRAGRGAAGNGRHSSSRTVSSARRISARPHLRGRGSARSPHPTGLPRGRASPVPPRPVPLRPAPPVPLL